MLFSKSGLTAILGLLLALPMAGQSRYDRLVFHYLKLSSALSRSDFRQAAAQAAKLNSQCRENGPQNLVAAAENLQKAADLNSLREAFSPFSDSLSLCLRNGKIKAAEKLFLVHCPMAFNDRGADWISDEPKVINPYFGDEMLHCGRVKETLSPEKK